MPLPEACSISVGLSVFLQPAEICKCDALGNPGDSLPSPKPWLGCPRSSPSSRCQEIRRPG